MSLYEISLLRTPALLALGLAGIVSVCGARGHEDEWRREVIATEVLTASAAPAIAQAGTYVLTLDVESASFEFLGGTWQLSYAGQYQDSYYFTTPGPGTGEARGRWIAEGLRAGRYRIDFWSQLGDHPQDARFRIAHAGGITNAVVDLNQEPTGWLALGEFAVRDTCVVEVSDYWTGAGSVLALDAIRFTLLDPLPDPPVSPVVPRIGICIDDAGSVNPLDPAQPIYKILRLHWPVTVAVLPARTFTAQTAEEIHRLGSEVILHQPMGAISIPNSGAQGINEGMTPEQIRAVVVSNLDALPHVTGLNNHTGSRVTQLADHLQPCMEVLAERSLYFYDSRTYTYSVAYDVARDAGLLTGERDLFIDGASQAESKSLILRLAQAALHAPEVPHLGIGHVRANTAAALQEVVPELKAMGVEIWPTGKCMSLLIEADSQPFGCTFAAEGLLIPEAGEDCASKELRAGHAAMVQRVDPGLPAQATFRAQIPLAGWYDVYAIGHGPALEGGALSLAITHRNGLAKGPIGAPSSPCRWEWMGRFPFGTETPAVIEFSDEDTPQESAGGVRVDAVRLTYAGEAGSLACGWMTGDRGAF